MQQRDDEDDVESFSFQFGEGIRVPGFSSGSSNHSSLLGGQKLPEIMNGNGVVIYGGVLRGGI